MRTPTVLPCLLVLAGLAAPVARAELTCPAPVFQAGPLNSGKALVHRFSLVNRGSQAVVVNEVKPGCGCLSAALDRKKFAPGESGTLTVEINTVTQPAGPNTWTVSVRGSQADRPFELPLRVQAHLTADLAVQPATLVVYTDRAVSHAFTLSEHRPEPVTVRAATTSSPHFRASVGEVSGQSGQWSRRIALEVLASCPDGRYEDVLHLHTSDPVSPELKVPFTVVKRSPGRVQASPPSVEWLLLGKQPLPARIVLLSTGDDQPVEIERIVSSDPSLKCTWAAGPGSRATLRIQVDRDRLGAGGLDGAIQVHLKKPASQVVSVLVRCLAR